MYTSLEQIEARAKTAVVYDIAQDLCFVGYLHVLPSGKTLVCRCEDERFHWSTAGKAISEQQALSMLRL